MSTNTQETINRLRELDRVTAPAPWAETINEENPDIPCLLLDANGGQVAEGEADWEGFWPNLDNTVGLLTELRNALPILLAEIDRLTAENTQLLDTVAEAWDEGYMDKEAEAPEEMIERGLRKRAQNPYKKDN